MTNNENEVTSNNPAADASAPQAQPAPESLPTTPSESGPTAQPPAASAAGADSGARQEASKIAAPAMTPAPRDAGSMADAPSGTRSGPSEDPSPVVEDSNSQMREQYPRPDAVIAHEPEPDYAQPSEALGADEDDASMEAVSDDADAGPLEAVADEEEAPPVEPVGPVEERGPIPSAPPAPQPRREGRHRRRGGRGRGGEPARAEHRQERDRHDGGRRAAEGHRGRLERGGHQEREYRSDHRGPARDVKREILANTNFEETRIAILENGHLAELLWERKNSQNIVGNIYKGVVENVLPGISSAFVNIGFEKNAYLYISDVLGEKGAAIDATLRKGQHIMIQVAKEAIGTKGMKVTMDVSLPGRFLVFTPFQSYVGISKHIGDAAERARLSGIVDRLVAEQLGGKGVVVRTEAEGASEAELEREVKYLLQTWNQIYKKFETEPPPALLHKDLDIALQVARDLLSDKVYVYLLDNREQHKNVVEFVEAISPELKDRVRLYDAKTQIFKAFNLEGDIESMRRTKVTLANGGSIIIQEAESLCAIDVNTGRFTGSKSQEETVTQTNIEAALEIAHQLRLRNIGGIIVVDFIDMRKASNRQKVMEAFAHACKGDRAKIRILPITRLGLVELTRERKRESTVSLITEECPQCKGCGRVLSSETLRIRIQREIAQMTGGRPGGQVRLLLHPALAEQFRGQQPAIEKNIQRSVKIQSDPSLPWEDYRIVLE